MKYQQTYCLIYVFSESPFEMVGRIRSLLKFTPPIWNCHWWQIRYWQIYVFSESPFETAQVYSSSYQHHLQVYCQSHLQVYPLIWNCHWCQIKYWQIYVFSESPFETAQVYSSSLLCRFTHKFYPPHLKLSLMAHQVLADLCLQWEPIQNCSSLPVSFTSPFETASYDRSSIGRSMSSVRAHSKLLKFTPQVYL